MMNREMQNATSVHFDFSTVKGTNVAEFFRYVAVSMLALAVDYSVYLLLIHGVLLDIPVAAVIGYLIGMIVSYVFMASKVFGGGWLRRCRVVEALLFLFSGLVGLTVTFITSSGVVYLFGDQVQLAKITSVAISFIVVYRIRKYMIFNKKRPVFVFNR